MEKVKWLSSEPPPSHWHRQQGKPTIRRDCLNNSIAIRSNAINLQLLSLLLFLLDWTECCVYADYLSKLCSYHCFTSTTIVPHSQQQLLYYFHHTYVILCDQLFILKRVWQTKLMVQKYAKATWDAWDCLKGVSSNHFPPLPIWNMTADRSA